MELCDRAFFFFFKCLFVIMYPRLTLESEDSLEPPGHPQGWPHRLCHNSWLVGVVDQIQDFMHARQALYQCTVQAGLGMLTVSPQPPGYRCPAHPY